MRAGISVASRRKARISVYSDKRVTRWDSHPDCERKPRHLKRPSRSNAPSVSLATSAEQSPQCRVAQLGLPMLLRCCTSLGPRNLSICSDSLEIPGVSPRSTHSPARLRGCAPASSHLRLETKLLALWCAQPHPAPPARHSRCRPTAGPPACSSTAGTRNTPRSAAPGTAHTARSSCRSDSMERSPRAHARRRSDRHGSAPFRPAAVRQEGGTAAC